MRLYVVIALALLGCKDRKYDSAVPDRELTQWCQVEIDRLKEEVEKTKSAGPGWCFAYEDGTSPTPEVCAPSMAVCVQVRNAAEKSFGQRGIDRQLGDCGRR